MELNSGLMSPMSQREMGDTTPRPSWQWAVRLCYLWSCECYGQGIQEHGAPIQFRNTLETRISWTSSIFRQGACGGSLVSPPSPLVSQWTCPPWSVCQWSVRGYKLYSATASSSWVQVWLFQIPAEEGESIPWQCYRETETWVLMSMQGSVCLWKPFPFWS